MSLLPNNIHPSWGPLLSKEFVTQLTAIEDALNQLTIHEASNYRYFPKSENVMRFLEIDLKKIKYIILGMDPYPSWYKIDGAILPVATGRSFEVGNVNSWQQKFKQNSLQNIVKTIYYNQTGEKKNLPEIRELLANSAFELSPPLQWFDNLEKQGVLFLNATLTVAPDCPDSHTQLWQNTMSEVIRYIDDNYKPSWLLFGEKAKNRIREALPGDYKEYTCCHPRLNKFITANIFAAIEDIEWCGNNETWRRNG